MRCVRSLTAWRCTMASASVAWHDTDKQRQMMTMTADDDAELTSRTGAGVAMPLCTRVPLTHSTAPCAEPTRASHHTRASPPRARCSSATSRAQGRRVLSGPLSHMEPSGPAPTVEPSGRCPTAACPIRFPRAERGRQQQLPHSSALIVSSSSSTAPHAQSSPQGRGGGHGARVSVSERECVCTWWECV